jgi:hypothetical protein
MDGTLLAVWIISGLVAGGGPDPPIDPVGKPQPVPWIPLLVAVAGGVLPYSLNENISSSPSSAFSLVTRVPGTGPAGEMKGPLPLFSRAR